ncbi:hypothetical protein D2T29_12340 [Sinirhodobacter populi]|uniref:HTH DNA binding domain-containing protein n=1 Tax=Paenirhodobacter populi TaxID=2306993 RepID=A0A443KCD7_9RHOB|nr:hypothetical protein [Sinirhodobacter populi]RWR30454.1 hypothetical protein D2T29_12340 [Sinirhodobacter populi]
MEDEESDDIGPYDRKQSDEDLWFVPPFESDEEEDPFAMPLPKAPRQSLLDHSEWRAAEALHSHAIADLRFDLGRLVERVQMMGRETVERLAHAEAASLSWWLGQRISQDRIALFLAWRISATGGDTEALQSVAWAARRLMAPPHTDGSLADRIVSHLGIGHLKDMDATGDLADLIPDGSDLDAITTACAVFHLWRTLADRPDHAREIEAAVIGARLAMANAGQHLGFVPISLAGSKPLTASGSVERKLAGWIAGIHASILSALLTLERLRQWKSGATVAIEDLNGRIPMLLIGIFSHHPMIAGPQIEEESGASQAAVQRNLKIFHDRGLIREVTGQGRFRVWTARM